MYVSMSVCFSDQLCEFFKVIFFGCSTERSVIEWIGVPYRSIACINLTPYNGSYLQSLQIFVITEANVYIL